MWHYGEVMPASVWAEHRRATETFDKFVLALPDFMEHMYAERHPSTKMSSMTIDQMVDRSVQVFNLEDVPNQLPPYLRQFGITDVEIPHHNTTSHKPYRGYYSRRTRRAVKKFMPADIEAGSYTF